MYNVRKKETKRRKEADRRSSGEWFSLLTLFQYGVSGVGSVRSEWTRGGGGRREDEGVVQELLSG